MKDLTFLSLTNKTLDLPKNVISAGINSTSQFNTIKKFLDENNLKETLFLTPIQNFEFEIKDGLKNSKIKIFKIRGNDDDVKWEAAAAERRQPRGLARPDRGRAAAGDSDARGHDPRADDEERLVLPDESAVHFHAARWLGAGLDRGLGRGHGPTARHDDGGPRSHAESKHVRRPNATVRSGSAGHRAGRRRAA